MSFQLRNERSRYSELLRRYLEHNDEAALLMINDLGREWMAQGVPQEAIIELHMKSIAEHGYGILEEYDEPSGSDLHRESVYQKQFTPLMEAIMAYGMAFRDYHCQQLSHQEDNFYRVLEQSPSIVFVLSEENKIIYANPAYQLHCGDFKPCGTMLSRSRLQPEEALTNQQGLWDALDEERCWKGVVHFSTANYKDLLLAVSAFPLFDASNSKQGIVFIGEDISEKRRLEKQLQQSQRLATLGELAAGVAHEVNNVFHIISGFSELAEKELHGSGVGSYLSEIRGAIDKGQALIEQVQSLARPTDQLASSVMLSDLVGSLRSLLKGFHAEGIKVELNAAGKSTQIVHVAPNHLHQIVTNLALNSIHAVAKRYPIKKDSSASDKYGNGRVTISLELEVGKFVVRVLDNGEGMPESIKDKIFDPFYTTKAYGEGTGLGLAIVQRIVTEYHGLIKVCSRPEEGTEFIIEFADPGGHAGANKDSGSASAAVEVGFIGEDLFACSYRSVSCQLADGDGHRVQYFADLNQALRWFERSHASPKLFIVSWDREQARLVEMLEQFKLISDQVRFLLLYSGWGETNSVESSQDGIWVAAKPTTITGLENLVNQLVERMTEQSLMKVKFNGKNIIGG